MNNSAKHLNCYAVKVRSRGEEAIAKALRAKHYEVLFPTYPVVKQYSDRVLKESHALFAGYLFVIMNPSKVLDLVMTEGVSYVVKSASGLLALSEAETLMIEALCQPGSAQLLEPCSMLRVGQRVRIEAGLFAGFEGQLVRVRDVDRVVVIVETLNSAVSIEIGHTRVQVLNTSERMAGAVEMNLQAPSALGAGVQFTAH